MSGTRQWKKPKVDRNEKIACQFCEKLISRSNISTHEKTCNKRELVEYKFDLNTLISQSKSLSERLHDLENEFAVVKNERDVFKNSYYTLFDSIIQYKDGKLPKIQKAVPAEVVLDNTKIKYNEW